MQLVDTTDAFPFVAGPREGGLSASNPQHMKVLRLGLEERLRQGKRVLSMSSKVRRGLCCGFCVDRQDRLMVAPRAVPLMHRRKCFGIYECKYVVVP